MRYLILILIFSAFFTACKSSQVQKNDLEFFQLPAVQADPRVEGAAMAQLQSNKEEISVYFNDKKYSTSQIDSIFKANPEWSFTFEMDSAANRIILK